MKLRDGWVAVALSSDIEPSAVAGVTVEGRELALWRAGSGLVHVWEDRCPHRGMRLSFGFVRGDRLGCLYHGWQYDGGGQCRHIPAHPELAVPATIRVPTFPAVESGGVIWTAFAAGSPPPDFGEAVPVRSLYLDAPLSRAVATLDAFAVERFAEDAAGRAAPAPGLVAVWTVPTGAGRLLIAGQDVDAVRSALHVTILGPSASWSGAGQAHFGRWAERLRFAIEADALARGVA